MSIEPDTLNEVIPKYLEDGWQVVCTPTVQRTSVSTDSSSACDECVHAIGDRTNGAVLDALEVALEHADVPAIRPRIEHAQIMDRNDIARLGKTGGKYIRPSRGVKLTADSGNTVIASVQPIHVWVLLSDCGEVLTCL